MVQGGGAHGQRCNMPGVDVSCEGGRKPTRSGDHCLPLKSRKMDRASSFPWSRAQGLEARFPGSWGEPISVASGVLWRRFIVQRAEGPAEQRGNQDVCPAPRCRKSK